jgi:hypothetical protein
MLSSLIELILNSFKNKPAELDVELLSRGDLVCNISNEYIKK